MKPNLRIVRIRGTTSDVDLLGGFATWMRSWGAADNTIRERLSVLGVGIRAWGDPLAVTTPALAAWLGQEQYGAWTRVSYYHHLRSYFGWLETQGLLTDNPMRGLRPPKSPKCRPRPLSDADVVTVLAAATGNTRTWLLLGLLAGLRAFEIAKLRGEDIDEHAIFVVGKGNKQAFVPTHPDLWALAATYPREGWWFPAQPGSKLPHVYATSVSSLVTRHFRKFGIDGSLHRCRHTYATSLLRSGVNIRVVQTLMRHDSLATTAAYTAVDEDERAAAVRRLGWAA